MWFREDPYEFFEELAAKMPLDESTAPERPADPDP